MWIHRIGTAQVQLLLQTRLINCKTAKLSLCTTVATPTLTRQFRKSLQTSERKDYAQAELILRLVVQLLQTLPVVQATITIPVQAAVQIITTPAVQVAVTRVAPTAGVTGGARFTQAAKTRQVVGVGKTHKVASATALAAARVKAVAA